MALVYTVVYTVNAAQTMKKLRIIIETDISTWLPDQIEAYKAFLDGLLRLNDGTPLGDKQTWIVEESEEKQ